MSAIDDSARRALVLAHVRSLDHDRGTRPYTEGYEEELADFICAVLPVPGTEVNRSSRQDPKGAVFRMECPFHGVRYGANFVGYLCPRCFYVAMDRFEEMHTAEQVRAEIVLALVRKEKDWR